jgi:thiol-disulfide isomerase/thioredoxin
MARFMLVVLLHSVSAFMDGVTTLRGFQDKVTECTPGKVVELTPDENIQSFITKNANNAILFYSSLCDSCQKILPHWATAASDLKVHDPPVCFAKANADTFSRQLRDQFKITEYPHVTQVIDGTLHLFPTRLSARVATPSLFTSWIKHTYKQDNVLESIDDVEAFSRNVLTTSSCDKVIVGLVEPGSEEQRIFMKLTSHFDPGKLTFVELHSEASATALVHEYAHKVASEGILLDAPVNLRTPSVFLLSREGYEHYEKSFTDTNSLNVFVGLVEQPLVQHINDYDFDEGEQGSDIRVRTDGSEMHVPSLLIFFHEPDVPTPPWFANGARALRHAEVNLHAVINPVEADPPIGSRAAMIVKRCGLLPDSKLPAIRIAEVTMTKVNKFQPAHEITNEAQLIEFGQKWGRGEVPSYMRSLPRPEPLPSGRYEELVADTWTEFIEEKPDKDIFVNCFAPWCGHCRNFRPLFQELQRKTRHVKTLDVFFFDATQNDLPEEIRVNSYPTLYFFPALRDGETKRAPPMKYSEERSIERMLDYLHTQATHDFSNNVTHDEYDESEDGILSGFNHDL